MWRSGEAPKLAWEKHLPLIGGELADGTAVSVEFAEGDGFSHRGAVALADGEILCAPGDQSRVHGLRPRRKETVKLLVELESRDEDGALLDTMTREVEITLGLNHHHGSTYVELSDVGVQSRDEAVATTKGGGGTLAVIDDEAENVFVAGIFAPTHDRPIWIGADDLAEAGVFVDLTGNVLAGGDTNWAPGEPNDWGGDEPYVTTGTDGPWNDAAPNTGWITRTVLVIDVATQERPVPGGSADGDQAGTRFGDWIFGTNGVNAILGKGGDDVLRGEGGDDTLLGRPVRRGPGSRSPRRSRRGGGRAALQASRSGQAAPRLAFAPEGHAGRWRGALEAGGVPPPSRLRPVFAGRRYAAPIPG